jgi:hypothetical protein
MKTFCLIFLAALFVLIAFVNPAFACPNCKDAIHESQNHLAAGYFFSILFMMSMPFTLLTGWTIALVRLRRLKRTRSDSTNWGADTQ